MKNIEPDIVDLIEEIQVAIVKSIGKEKASLLEAKLAVEFRALRDALEPIKAALKDEMQDNSQNHKK